MYKPTKYFIDRLEVFNDSYEVADNLNCVSSFGETDYSAFNRYDNNEAMVHIIGLWDFAVEAVTKIKELEKECQKLKKKLN